MTNYKFRMKENIIQEKSYKFALRIIKLFLYLKDQKNEFVLSKQVLKSGTSIGANIEEGIGALTKKDFINKFTIAYKEARETHYWIRLLKDSDFIDVKMAQSLHDDCEELMKIISKIQITSKQNSTNNV